MAVQIIAAVEVDQGVVLLHHLDYLLCGKCVGCHLCSVFLIIICGSFEVRELSFKTLNISYLLNPTFFYMRLSVGSVVFVSSA